MAFRHLRSWVKTTLPRRNNVAPPEEGVNPQKGVMIRPERAVHSPQNDAVPTHVGQIGLFRINPIEPEAEVASSGERFQVDIVAIHGITGDAFKTWTHENGTNWLRDFLPSAFPGARIFSFGYPAEVFWSRSDGDIDSFARSLLEGLKRERRQLKHRCRRTIFICHSMGGIVVKKVEQALTIARIDDDDYGEIRRSVSAILFLSTPHRGAGFASILKLPLQIVSSASLPIVSITGKTRKDLVKGLEKDAEPLKEISRNFRNSMKDIKIASFIEKSFVPPLKKVIVDEGTGAMGTPGERLVPMHGCDHRTVCRFESETSFGYQSILEVLQDWAGEAREDVDMFSQEDISCLNSLAFLEMDWRRSDADKAHPKTCTWILQHESYTRWLSNQRGLLWIKGKPGAGKSTLLAFVYRIFQENISDQADLNLEFFFHGRGAVLQKTSIGMFRSLLHQLYSRDWSLRDSIRKAFHEKLVFGEVGTGWQWQLRELQDLFFNVVLAGAKSRRIVIFIDALDEAGPDARDLVDYFHRMNDELNKTNSRASICISCRHYPVTAVIPGLDILVEENNLDDISLYIKARLRANVRVEQNEQDSKAWSRIEKQIVEDSSGVFQWARLVAKMVLEHSEEGDSWDDIHLMLAKVPRELGAVYEHILTNIIKPERRKKTLHLMQWVFLAERPLTLDELREAMAFDDIHMSSDVHSYHDMKRYIEIYSGMHKLVNSLSGGLAEVKYHEQKNIVQFIHQSVNDFLLSTGLEFLASKTAEVPPSQTAQEITRIPTNVIIGQGQDRLSRSCINYLRLAKFNRKKIFLDLGSKQLNLPFINYATKFWPVHAGKAEQNDISQEHLVEEFGARGQLLDKWLNIYPIVSTSTLEDPKSGLTFLHLASDLNLRSVVRLLLQGDALIEAEDESGDRALHYAARRGHKEVVEMLLKANAKVDAENRFGKTPIEYAARNRRGEIVDILLNDGSSIGNALQDAARAGSMGLVKFLLNSGADVNAAGENKCSALQAAAAGEQENIVQLLIDKGANINQLSGDDGSAIQAAAARGHESIFRLLLDAGADVHLQRGDYGSTLQAAIHGGNRVIIDAILDKGADINAQGGYFGTPLQAAASEGDLAVVQLLLENGANVNIQRGNQGDALQGACIRGQFACAKLLLKWGADVNAQCGINGNPLQAAAANGNPELVELLLQNGAKVNARAGHSGTALQAAAFGGKSKVMELLLRKGAEINAEGGYFGTALQAAAAGGHHDAIDLLLKSGAEANLKGGIYGSAIQAAVTRPAGFVTMSITALLLEHGADVNIKGGGPNALHIAIANGDIEIIELLLRHRAVLDPGDEEFSTALISAAEDPTRPVKNMLEARGYEVRPDPDT